MKKGLIITSILLLIPICLLTYIYFKKSNNYTVVIKEIDGENKKIIEVEKKKMDELNKVMEENKDKVEKLEKIEKWNKEIISYLE